MYCLKLKVISVFDTKTNHGPIYKHNPSTSTNHSTANSARAAGSDCEFVT